MQGIRTSVVVGLIGLATTACAMTVDEQLISEFSGYPGVRIVDKTSRDALMLADSQYDETVRWAVNAGTFDICLARTSSENTWNGASRRRINAGETVSLGRAPSVGVRSIVWEAEHDPTCQDPIS